MLFVWKRAAAVLAIVLLLATASATAQLAPGTGGTGRRLGSAWRHGTDGTHLEALSSKLKLLNASNEHVCVNEPS